MVARERRTGETLRVWADELEAMFLPPFPIGPDSLFVAYYASAELGCFPALGWPMPARVLDLFCEFRHLTNGSETWPAMACWGPWPTSVLVRSTRPRNTICESWH